MAMEPAAFDKHDLERVELELRLATRAGTLNEPLKVMSHEYASADYWVLTIASPLEEEVEGVTGILQFYGVPEELWIGYLSAKSRRGSILTEEILRQGRELSFDKLLVWTTNDNQRAISFYQRALFTSTSARPKDTERVDGIAAFERSALPPPITIPSQI